MNPCCSCDFELPDGAGFCPRCGAKQSVEEALSQDSDDSILDELVSDESLTSTRMGMPIPLISGESVSDDDLGATLVMDSPFFPPPAAKDDSNDEHSHRPLLAAESVAPAIEVQASKVREAEPDVGQSPVEVDRVVVEVQSADALEMADESTSNAPLLSSSDGEPRQKALGLLLVGLLFLGLGTAGLAWSFSGKGRVTVPETENSRPIVQSTPLMLTQPIAGCCAGQSEWVLVGQTIPTAKVVIGTEVIPVDAKGHFRFVRSLADMDTDEISLVVSAPGMTSEERLFKIEKMDSEELKKRQNDAQARVRGAHEKKVAPFRDVLQKMNEFKGRTLFFTGWLADIHRMDKVSNRLLLKTCTDADGCPVWIETDKQVLVSIGSAVAAAGRVAGTEDYISLEGESRTALILEQGEVSP